MKGIIPKKGFGCSDVGLVRPVNEDSFIANNHNGVYAVADGMGGLPYGEVASQLAIDLITNLTNEHADKDDVSMEMWFDFVQRVVRKKGREIAPRSGIGTTLTVVRTLRDNRIQIGHCGDSSVYRIRADSIESITPSHSSTRPTVRVLNQSSPDSSTNVFEVLENFIGHPNPPEPFIKQLGIPEGTRLLICTDGISRYLEESEIHVIHRAQSSPKAFCESLIHIVNLRGGFDNATAVAVDL